MSARRWSGVLASVWALAACAPAPHPVDPVDAAVAIDGADAAVAPRAVLLVGNSYTYYGDLPGEVAALAPADAPLITTSITIGGASLSDHWGGEARPAIEAGGHDVVVLQGHSLEPIIGAETFATSADALAGAATAAGAEVVFYGTWARRAGDPFFDDPRSGGTPPAMQDLLTAGYVAAAARTQARLAPVGEGFRLVLAEAPTLNLYDPDGSHPSPAGTYLAAATLVEAITGQPATDAERLGLDAATRAALRDAAHRALQGL
ncbi:MAG: hypothetical protein IPL61_34500 [Myxococcales bacterium]|nr:hypothetical protein [Myxococcales bacterium]